MIEVLFIRNQQGEIIRFTARGHADTAKFGEDILCAAVSALIQGAVIGLENYSQPKIEKNNKRGSTTSDNGFIDVWVGEGKEPVAVSAIVQTLYLSLKRIEKDYKKHLMVIEKEANLC